MKVLLTAILGTILLLGMSFSAESREIVLTKHNTVVLNQAFTGKSVAEVQKKLLDLSLKSGQDLYLFLYSPGGSINAGKQLITFAKALPNKVHTITQFAASMAYITAQQLDKRYVLASATMMSHRASIGGLGGQIPGEAGTRLNYINNIVREVFEDVAQRVGVGYDEYLKSVYDELWLTADLAVQNNHADEIITARCDESLSGLRTQYVNTMFGNFQVKFSNCPLITGPVDIGTSNTFFRNAVIKSLDYSSQKKFDLTL